MKRFRHMFSGNKHSFISPSVPAWKVNILVFGLLILVVLLNFFFQARQAEKVFTDNVREHSALLSEVVRLNAEGAVLSMEVVQEIMQTFLVNASHFIDYLDSVKPFAQEELVALAREFGLSGIRITSEDGNVREGPIDWLEGRAISPEIWKDTIRQGSEGNIFFYKYSRFQNGNIITGLVSERFQELQRKIGLAELFETVTGLAGIRYVRLAESVEEGSSQALGKVRIRDDGSGKVAETSLLFGKDTIVIGMGCDLYYARVVQNRREFFLFSAVILISGIICSLLLYAYHRAHFSQVREFEQTLAREREDAALGRATASITHEIRNPLNAISMGLQRLSMEVENLDEDYRDLIANLLRSVKRTDRIISDLNRFTGPLSPNIVSLQLFEIISSILNLYGKKIDEQRIHLTLSKNRDYPVAADRDMCEILVENLVKNAVEAQENGGFIRIEIDRVKKGREGDFIVLSMTNGGFTGDQAYPEKILEPYLTTKTRGSGVGLTIVRRIVDAHGGHLDLSVPEHGILQITVTLPETI